jgi:hypothetical protein
MTEVKIAQAWGTLLTDGGWLWATTNDHKTAVSCVPVLVVHGLTEAELLELLERRGEMLARQGECEWRKTVPKYSGYYSMEHTERILQVTTKPNFCPACGRKVVVE